VVIARVDRYHQKDCGARQRRDHRLGLRVAQLAFQAFILTFLGTLPAVAPRHPPKIWVGGL
jgi:hypothetical protein